MIPYNEENATKMRAVAEDLRGTCKSLDDALQAEFGEDADPMDVDIKLLQDLDDQVMQCEGCGWWCETGELNDNQTCGDCAPEDDDA